MAFDTRFYAQRFPVLPAKQSDTLSRPELDMRDDDYRYCDLMSGHHYRVRASIDVRGSASPVQYFVPVRSPARWPTGRALLLAGRPADATNYQ